MELFEIKNLKFAYPEQTNNAIDDITLSIQSGKYICLCGKSGCGKSTLLRHLKTVLTPYGERSGEIMFCGKPLEEVSLRDQSQRIGYVLQNPDNQIVTDKVWHELAFGLESLGYDNETIRLRVAEMASFFGIQTWFNKSVTELSGGQKQLLNLASIMAMQPDVLILDEPTSQLDPIASADFLATVAKINREIGTTILITEHRLEDVFPSADRVIVMDKGGIVASGTPKEVGETLKSENSEMFESMPTPMRIYAGVKSNLPCPITVREGRNWLSELNLESDEITNEKVEEKSKQEIVIEIKNAWFRYKRELPDVVCGVSLQVKKGEIFAVLGGNGTGKSTMLTLLSGINKAYRGKVFLGGKEISKIERSDLFSEFLGVLPQNPQALFVKKTVKEDLMQILTDRKIPKAEKEKLALEMAETVEITHLLDMHPYDTSGGEQQRIALAKVLLLSPSIILLDEPTKGMDNHFKNKFGKILKKLQAEGKTILLVSHDIEFCALFADRCGLFFNGDIVTIKNTNEFFGGNSFYTTTANRMARHIFKNAVTCEEVISLCNKR